MYGAIGYLMTPATTTPDLGQWLARVFNVHGSLPAHASMLAMPKQAQTNLYTGATRIDLGAPQRFSFANLVSKIRRTPQDNIQWL